MILKDNNLRGNDMKIIQEILWTEIYVFLLLYLNLY